MMSTQLSPNILSDPHLPSPVMPISIEVQCRNTHVDSVAGLKPNIHYSTLLKATSNHSTINNVDS